MKKKLLAILLSVAVAVTFVPTFAFAVEGQEEQAGEEPAVVDEVEDIDAADEALDAAEPEQEAAEEAKDEVHAMDTYSDFDNAPTIPFYGQTIQLAYDPELSWGEEDYPYCNLSYYKFTAAYTATYKLYTVPGGRNVWTQCDICVKDNNGYFVYIDCTTDTKEDEYYENYKAYTVTFNAQAGTTYYFEMYGDSDVASSYFFSFGLANPTVSVKSGTLPFKKKQSIGAGANLNLSQGDYVVSVSSSKPKVMGVSGTNLKAKKKNGKATVTVNLASGLSVSYKVKVQSGKVKGKPILGCAKSVTLARGQSLAINATKLPVTCKDKIKYKSSKKKVASVSKNGVITAKKKGTTKITVKVGSKKKTIKVKVL